MQSQALSVPGAKQFGVGAGGDLMHLVPEKAESR